MPKANSQKQQTDIPISIYGTSLIVFIALYCVQCRQWCAVEVGMRIVTRYRISNTKSQVHIACLPNDGPRNNKCSHLSIVFS